MQDSRERFLASSSKETLMSNDPHQSFGLRTAILLVVATMIGTGVFTTTGFLLRDLGSQPAVLMAWSRPRISWASP